MSAQVPLLPLGMSLSDAFAARVLLGFLEESSPGDTAVFMHRVHGLKTVFFAAD